MKFTSTILFLSATIISSVAAAPQPAANGAAPAIVCGRGTHYECWVHSGKEGCGCVRYDIGKRSAEGKAGCFPRQYWTCWLMPDGSEMCGCVDRDVGRKREASPQRCGPFTHWECWGPNDCGCVSNGGPHHG